MPFRIKIEKCHGNAEKLYISGIVISGAYMGPELVKIDLKNGKTVRGIIKSHAFDFFGGWPVLPGQYTIVKMEIDLLEKTNPKLVDKYLRGVGPILLNEQRVDITEQFANPLFWCCQLNELFVDEDGEYLLSKAFNIGMKEVHQYYQETFADAHAQGVWPYARIPLVNEMYLEIEYSAGVELQTRYWLGKSDGLRILLAYESSHLSLPGIRYQEMLRLFELLPPGNEPYRILSWLPCCYLQKDEQLDALLERVTEIPGFTKQKEEWFCSYVAHQQTVEELEWRHHPEKGWINNWDYSQRNPESRMSLLKDSDFKQIEHFFTEW